MQLASLDHQPPRHLMVDCRRAVTWIGIGIIIIDGENTDIPISIVVCKMGELLPNMFHVRAVIANDHDEMRRTCRCIVKREDGPSASGNEEAGASVPNGSIWDVALAI
jgi:hypothetical protein